MSWHRVRGTVIGNEMINRPVFVVLQTTVVETDSGERLEIIPRVKLGIGDVIEFETNGKRIKFTWFLGRTKYNSRNVRILSRGTGLVSSPRRGATGQPKGLRAILSARRRASDEPSLTG